MGGSSLLIATNRFLDGIGKMPEWGLVYSICIRAAPRFPSPLSSRAPVIAIRKTKLRGFDLYYENQDATESMIRASDDFPSFFTPRDPEPVIIDCGANIGVSVLEWKSRWPMSRIICFEPDPSAFELLSLNVERNDIPGVRCIQSAVASFDGTTQLFGETGRGSDARGNSILAEWGSRDESDEITVGCQRLSPFLAAEPVSFLKMDIEGAEESVLAESSDYLRQVDALYVEVHETDDLADLNCCKRIERLLADAGFELEIESRFGEHALPPELDDWRVSVNARQTQLLCWRG